MEHLHGYVSALDLFVCFLAVVLFFEFWISVCTAYWQSKRPRLRLGGPVLYHTCEVLYFIPSKIHLLQATQQKHANMQRFFASKFFAPEKRKRYILIVYSYWNTLNSSRIFDLLEIPNGWKWQVFAGSNRTYQQPDAASLSARRPEMRLQLPRGGLAPSQGGKEKTPGRHVFFCWL